MAYTYVYATLEFQGSFTSYSPVLHEGYIDSTTLQAALVAVEAELLGNSNPLLASARFTSLLPLAHSRGEKDLPLLPPLRLPQIGAKITGFWTPRAASIVLDFLERYGTALLAYDADGSVYCILSGQQPEESKRCGIVYDAGRGIVRVSSEEVRFTPPKVRSDRHRLVIDRVTASATPYMLPVVEPRGSRYWFAAKIPAGQGSGKVCDVVENVLKLLEYVGLGAYRSAGFGRVKSFSLRCGDEPSEVLPEDLRLSGGGQYAVSLGLLLPRNAACSVIYGRATKFGLNRGYGGRVINFRRPLVMAAAPGSIVKLDNTRCEGVVVSGSAPAPYSYSFNPLLYPLSTR